MRSASGSGMAIVVAVRALYGWDPLFDWNAIITVGALVAAPLGFLIGIGCFDYWFCWAVGRTRRSPRTTRATAPTRGRTTSASTPTTR